MEALVNRRRTAVKRSWVWLALALGLLFLSAGMLCAAQDLQPPDEHAPQPESQAAAPATLTSVQGVVRNAATGAPLPRALVQIEGSSIAQLTDGEGRFELTGVAVGPEIIRLRKPGFLDHPYATEDVGYQNDGPAHSVLVVEGMPELNFALTPTSTIYGHIELSTGDPAEGFQLTLRKQVVKNGRAVWTQNGYTKTNGSGNYRFAGLPAGVYALFTTPKPENEPTAKLAQGAKIAQNGYPAVYYPAAPEFSGAEHIHLNAGDQAEANLLLTLEPLYSVKATVIAPNTKPSEGDGYGENFFSPEWKYTAAVLDPSSRDLSYNAEFNSASHTVETTLPDGRYTLLLGASRARSGAEQNPDYFWGISEFSVDGHAVANLQIALLSKISWPIHLRAVRTTPQYGASPRPDLKDLVSVTMTPAGDALESNTDENPMAEEIGPEVLDANGAAFGPHWLSTLVNDRSLCVDSFSAGGVNLAREPLNVPLGGSPPPMEITLRDDCAKLALTLPPGLADFLPGEEPFYTVYVVPDFDTTSDIPPMTMHPSSGGTLTVDGLTPGSYHVYVFNEPVRLEYRNPAVMAALPTAGQQVTLSAGETGNLMLEVPGR